MTKKSKKRDQTLEAWRHPISMDFTRLENAAGSAADKTKLRQTQGICHWYFWLAVWHQPNYGMVWGLAKAVAVWQEFGVQLIMSEEVECEGWFSWLKLQGSAEIIAWYSHSHMLQSIWEQPSLGQYLVEKAARTLCWYNLARLVS